MTLISGVVLLGAAVVIPRGLLEIKSLKTECSYTVPGYVNWYIHNGE